MYGWRVKSKIPFLMSRLIRLISWLKCATSTILHRMNRMLCLCFYNWTSTRQIQQNDMSTQRRQICLGIRWVWSESSRCAQWIAKDRRLLHADIEDSDQTWRMPRLIWVFAGRTLHFVCFVVLRLILFFIQLQICHSILTGVPYKLSFHL